VYSYIYANTNVDANAGYSMKHDSLSPLFAQVSCLSHPFSILYSRLRTWENIDTMKLSSFLAKAVWDRLQKLENAIQLSVDPLAPNS
jgi:hypothetical protein